MANRRCHQLPLIIIIFRCYWHDTGTERTDRRGQLDAILAATLALATHGRGQLPALTHARNGPWPPRPTPTSS
jgi:hypothetical protein